MHALVTGGAGFIGSHLCEKLLDLGYTVTVIDDLSTGKLENLSVCQENPRFTFLHESILDQTVFTRLPDSISIVFHLAAAVGVQFILDNPLESIHTNVLGTENVMQYVSRLNIKIIITSTSEIYGKNGGESLSETDDRILGSTDITRWSYSCSKALDEFIAFAYHRKFHVPVVITRLFNTCGPRQRGCYGMVIPRFIRQALKNEPITVFGDGAQIRSFTFISDTVAALVALADNERCVGEVFNIGGNEPISIYELAVLIKKKTGCSSPIRVISYTEAYGEGFEDMKRRVPNIEKIFSYIGFQPKVGIHQILEKTIDHIKNEMDVTNGKMEVCK